MTSHESRRCSAPQIAESTEVGLPPALFGAEGLPRADSPPFSHPPKRTKPEMETWTAAQLGDFLVGVDDARPAALTGTATSRRQDPKGDTMGKGRYSLVLIVGALVLVATACPPPPPLPPGSWENDTPLSLFWSSPPMTATRRSCGRSKPGPSATCSRTRRPSISSTPSDVQQRAKSCLHRRSASA